MLVYRVFRKDFRFRKCDLIGTLVERRKDLRGTDEIESGLKWARLIFPRLDRYAFLVVPREVETLDIL